MIKFAPVFQWLCVWSSVCFYWAEILRWVPQLTCFNIIYLEMLWLQQCPGLHNRDFKKMHKMCRIHMYWSLSIVLICKDHLIVAHFLHNLSVESSRFFFSHNPICTLTSRGEHIVLPSLILRQASGKLAHLTLLHPSLLSDRNILNNVKTEKKSLVFQRENLV